jgi:DNA-binding YbaB/EbfC family protein
MKRRAERSAEPKMKRRAADGQVRSSPKRVLVNLHVDTHTKEPDVRPGGQPNLQQLMKQAQKMQEQMVTAQAELAEAEVSGTAGGGLVTVTMRGSGEVVAVKIDPKAVDPDDVETLEDLVLAAIHNANDAVKQLTEEKMGPLTSGLGGLGGMGLPGM